jgi:hypothetical protein
MYGRAAAGAYVRSQAPMRTLLAHALFELPRVQTILHPRIGPPYLELRIRSDPWTAGGRFGTPKFRGCAMDGGGMEWCSLLVHSIDIVRQSSDNNRPFAD